MDSTVIAAIIGAISTIIAAIIGIITARSKDKAYSELQKEWGEYKKAIVDQSSYLNIDYGIRIISPTDEPVHGDTIEVRGTYKIMPPPGTLRLYTIAPDKTEYGERYWPQEIVKDFFPETKT